MMFFLTRFRFSKMLPKLFSLQSSKRYLRAIERNFLPEALVGPNTRANWAKARTKEEGPEEERPSGRWSHPSGRDCSAQRALSPVVSACL